MDDEKKPLSGAERQKRYRERAKNPKYNWVKVRLEVYIEEPTNRMLEEMARDTGTSKRQMLEAIIREAAMEHRRKKFKEKVIWMPRNVTG